MRLIDADKLKEHLFQDVEEQDRTVASCKNRTDDEVNAYRIGWNDALKAVAVSAPTVDAVPVIRCKDCKHQIKKKYRSDEGIYLRGWCSVCNILVPTGDNGYCSKGERKEETKC